jgi:hypothetical protein
MDTQELQAAAPATNGNGDHGSYITDAEELLALADITEQWFPIPALGGKQVKLRQLSRNEAKKLREQSTIVGPDGEERIDQEQFERKALRLSLISPKLKPEQLDRLFAGVAGVELEIIGQVMEFSRLRDAKKGGQNATAGTPVFPEATEEE